MDIVNYLYLACFVFGVVWFTIYISDESGWWVGMENFVPSWGNSEVLLLFIYGLWFISTLSLIYLLQQRDNEKRHRIIYFSLVLLTTALLSVEAYSLSDIKGNYKEAYYAALTAFIVSILTLIMAWKTRDKLLIWLGVLSFISSGYLGIWTCNVKDASGE
jgi:surface polysaccharide O-acyltransferase-like enzyme